MPAVEILGWRRFAPSAQFCKDSEIKQTPKWMSVWVWCFVGLRYYSYIGSANIPFISFTLHYHILIASKPRILKITLTHFGFWHITVPLRASKATMWTLLYFEDWEQVSPIVSFRKAYKVPKTSQPDYC